MPNESIFNLTNLLYKYHHWPTLFSFGILYGVVGLTLPILFLIIKIKNWIELIIMSNGLLMGYYFTHLIGTYVFGNGASYFGVFKFSHLNFAYVFCLYYIALGLIEVFSRYGTKAKYDHLFMGAHGICTGWILSRSFKEGSVIFSGLTFLVVSFISIILMEVTLGRLLKWIFGYALKSTESSSLRSLASIASFNTWDFWHPFLAFTGLIVGFPLISFVILSLVF